MSVGAGVAGARRGLRSQWGLRVQTAVGCSCPPGLLPELCCAEVMMKRHLPNWVILAGGTAVAAAAFFASSGITHWAMTLHRTDVVVVPGPTVYLPSPAGPSHAHKRAAPAPVAAVPVVGGAVQPRLDADARPDHKGDHGRPGHKGDHGRPGHKGDHGRPDHGERRSRLPDEADHHGHEGDRHAHDHGHEGDRHAPDTGHEGDRHAHDPGHESDRHAHDHGHWYH